MIIDSPYLGAETVAVVVTLEFVDCDIFRVVTYMPLRVATLAFVVCPLHNAFRQLVGFRKGI